MKKENNQDLDYSLPHKVALAIYKAVIFVLRRSGIGKFFLIRVVHKFVFRRLKSNFAIVQGHRMFLDSEDSLRLSIYGIYKKFEAGLLEKEIKQDDIVLDLGANIGYYTLIFAKLVGENGKVFAFEPDPTNFALLKKNVEINGYKNVVLINKAVSNKTRKLKLFLSEDNMGDHRIYDSKDGRKFIEVESVKLDDYFKNRNDKINFIKMDIQGAEYSAVEGMYNLLNKNKNVKIISEFWSTGLKMFGVEPIEYLKLLIKHNFKLYDLNEKRKLDSTNILRYTIKKEKVTNFLSTKL